MDPPNCYWERFEPASTTLSFDTMKSRTASSSKVATATSTRRAILTNSWIRQDLWD
jgi:hypothetical protein